MSKKLIAMVGIALCSFSLSGCLFGSNFSEYKDAEWYEAKKAFYVANELIGDVFNDERNKVFDEIEDLTETQYAKMNDDGSISLSNYKEKFRYAGELDGNTPDGIGVLYEEGYLGKELLPVYIGEWEDGKYSGYGQLYVAPNGYYKPHVITFEGYFENNKPSGKGIDYMVIPPRAEDKNGSLNLTYGENFNERYKVDGEVKKFVDGVLIFSADIDRESGYAKGKEYYKDGKLKYEGEFKNGLYHGDGVLYGNDGKEVYDGEWERGNYKR